MMDIAEIRKEYSLKTLNESGVLADPLAQFALWLKEAIGADVLEPNAMSLATATFDGRPSLRVVLLKGMEHGGFMFFSNYESRKAKEILRNPYSAAVFLWNELERQVRVEGMVHKISAEESDRYFLSRPEKNKLGSWASPQSQVIPNRKYLEDLMSDFEEEFAGKTITRPTNWGGYVLVPETIEFWQGRQNRLHDRIRYTEENGKWKIERLAP